MCNMTNGFLLQSFKPPFAVNKETFKFKARYQRLSDLDVSLMYSFIYSKGCLIVCILGFQPISSQFRLHAEEVLDRSGATQLFVQQFRAL